jgi:hypothetical protein
MPSDGASHCMTIYDRGQPVFYGTIGLDWQAAGVAQVILSCAMSTRRVPGLQYRQQSAHRIGEPGGGWLGLAAWRLRAHYSDWLYGQTISPCQTHLVQAMAGFGGDSGAADGLNAGVVNAGARQPLLTTPQHT